MKNAVSDLVESELSKISDAALVTAIRPLLVTPYPVERAWDYALEGGKYTCWTVLEHPPSSTGIAYCESGFGPSSSWGLVVLAGEYMSMGMDAAWFARLEDAMRESAAWEGPNPAGYETA